MGYYFLGTSFQFLALGQVAVISKIGHDMNDDQFSRDAQDGLEPYSPITTPLVHVGTGKPLSLRMYSFALTGLVFFGFVVMGVSASLFSRTAFLLFLFNIFLPVTLGSFVASILGIVMMSRAKSTQATVLSLCGYALFVLSFGFTTSSVLLFYTAQTISTAFLATAGIVVTFGCLGVLFPHFFAKIQGVLTAALLGLIIVQLVMMFVGVQQTWVDFAVIVVFCGFIAYDFHRASVDTPTLVNAVYYSSELFLDIINVFIRVLSIFGWRN